MPEKEIELRQRELRLNLTEARTRIRRYSLDPRLRSSHETQVGAGDDKPAAAQDAELAARLRQLTDGAWDEWLAARDQFVALPSPPTVDALAAVEKSLLKLDRKLDLIQRELISEKSFEAGLKTVLWMAAALVGLALFYLFTHGLRGLDFSNFEPWPEWGPLKYGEVAFWSSFGVLCWLLFLATWYLARRDFDKWYQPWYLSTALRAPFLTTILMLIVLEFVEWYGEGTRIQNYLLEEGNKYYFIIFMSFCLGLTSDRTSRIIGDLAEGVGDFVQNVVTRITRWLSAATSNTPSTRD